MKNLLWMGLLFVLTAFPVQAEVVQTVNFNPVRLGLYERLAVSDSAVFKGGFVASSMQIRSNGTVTIYGSNDDLAYNIKTLNAKNGEDTYSGGVFPSHATVDFPNMCFSSLENCVDATDVGNLKLNFNNGGAAKFRAKTTADSRASRIKKITTASERLSLESFYAKINGLLSVTTSVKLAGNTISKPSDTSGTLVWESRKTVQKSGSSAKTVKVLALKDGGDSSCSASESIISRCEDESRSGHKGTWNVTACRCDCPAGTVLDEESQCLATCNVSQNAIDRCEFPSRTGHRGTWSSASCKCICPAGTALDRDGGCSNLCNEGDNISTGCACLEIYGGMVWVDEGEMGKFTYCSFRPCTTLYSGKRLLRQEIDGVCYYCSYQNGHDYVELDDVAKECILHDDPEVGGWGGGF